MKMDSIPNNINSNFYVGLRRTKSEYIHNDDRKWFLCKLCMYESLSLQGIRVHIAKGHNIHDNACIYCQQKDNIITELKDRIKELENSSEE
jgi:hypothetical protein